MNKPAIDFVTLQDGESANIVSENIERLKSIFPEAFGDGSLNFETLRQLLGDAGVTDDGEEKYSLNWHGKKKARQIALMPSTGTLLPCPEESVDWDTTKNIFIEGDNLEVLKLLQKSYAGKIKMIYIDPPYNTGKEFIYPDRFQENLDTYLKYTGQIDDDGMKFSSNTETSGRKHTNWLNMIYPRIKIARSLLKENGIIFISIGDDEVHNLRKVCDEIFGEENFCAQFIWNTEGNTDNQYAIKVNHEYIIAYYKNINFSEVSVGRVIDPNTPEESNLRKGYADNNINKNNPENPPSVVELPAGFPSSEETLYYKAKNLDENFFKKTAEEKFISDPIRDKYGIEKKSGLPVKMDDMVVENFVLSKPCKIYVGMANKNKLLEFIKNGFKEIIDDDGCPIRFYINSNAAVRYRKQNENPRNILSVLRSMGTTEKTKTYLRKLGVFYDYPKPVDLIKYLIKIGCESDEIVLDFFAGSGTTSEAVYAINSAENRNKKFILVQLPEPLDPSKKEQKAAFDFCVENHQPPNLASISKERIRRVSKKTKDETPYYFGDLGFKVFKLSSSNIKAWNPDRTDIEKTLLSHQEHLVEGRTEQDVLYELLIKRGIDLTVPIECKAVSGKNIYSIGYGVIFACLDTVISSADIEPVAQGILDWYRELSPASDTHVFFRDSAFGDDIAKTNMAAILEQNGITHVRSL
ncbi:site-specific DNA-methyltransferase [Cupriavidus sp. 2MCAB6]|uniref:site-specific DNA-methyltransferase n=1 Tax=Cupriavidus sp. 2MCAB6 TaxID=3232981 RepID=UPI003F8FD9D9